MKPTTLIALATVLLTTACFPAGGSYLRIEQPDATYLSDSCYGKVGAPRTAYFPYHGIYLSAGLHERERAVMIGLHVPHGHTAQLLSRDIAIGDIRTNLKAARNSRYSGNKPYPFRNREQLDDLDFFAPVTGETFVVTFMIGSSIDAYKWHELEAKADYDLPSSGTLTFPAIRIDGTEYPGPVLRFRQSAYVDIAPLNC